MGGADDEDACALDEGLGGPAGAWHHLIIEGGGHGGLVGDAQLDEELGERLGGRLPGLVVNIHTHMKTTLPPWGRAGKRRFGIAGRGGLVCLLPMQLFRLLAACLLGLTAAQAANTPAITMKESADPKAAPRAIIHTNYGDMTVEFWPEVAPRTVDNFLKLSREKFYNGTAFHRIIKGFMIQGGCPNSKIGAKGQPGTGSPGYMIKAEFNNRAHVKGVLSMARSSDPDSAGSQFFVCHGDASFLNNKYTAFGKLVAGEDVLNKIALIACVGLEGSTPTERVEITSVEIVGETGK